MNRLLDISLVLNITGLAVVSALEAWRPGFVTSAVNIGVVWVGAVLLISVGLFAKHKTKPSLM